MRRREYDLENRLVEMLGPGPGPEKFVLDQLDDSQFAWHLEHDGRLVPPDAISPEWRQYAEEALCRLGRTKGMGVGLAAGQKHRA
ncbi:hypothetical protein J7643_09335 [bacterium]|nr:hypothetical protein [bacterium]